MLIRFGFLDSRDAVASENFHIYPDENIDNNQVRDQTDGGWYVAKSLRTRRFSVPLNYFLEGDFISEEHARFCVWGLSFVYGVRLGTSINEFIDALCINTKSLGFWVYGNNLASIMNIIYNRYIEEKKSVNIKRLVAIINLIFLSHNFVYERREAYLYLYMALDASFAYLRDRGLFGKRHIRHGERAVEIAKIFNIKCPDKLQEVVKWRNDLFHEGMVGGKPLGYEPIRENILSFRHFLCKIVFCLLGVDCKEYIEDVPCESLDLFPIIIR